MTALARGGAAPPEPRPSTLPLLDTSPLDRHECIGLAFSGGKDSLAVLWLLRPHLHRITIYCVETGDGLPEIDATIAAARAICPRFVMVTTDVRSWIAANGLPTDLLPFTAHMTNRMRGYGHTPLVWRDDCCWRNRNAPLYARMKEDGVTLLITGTRSADMPRLPARSGDVSEGLEFWLPIQEWTDAQVYEYLRREGAPLSAVYDRLNTLPECARCTAWWSERRGAYLRERHPALWRDYAAGLRAVFEELRGPLVELSAELTDTQDAAG